MQQTISTSVTSRDEAPKSRSPRAALLRLFPRKSPSREAQLLNQIENENAGLRAQIAQYQKEEGEFESGRPYFAGSHRIAEIAAPIAAAPLRATVGSPSMAGYFATADSWHVVLNYLLKQPSRVLDIGCGCGKLARLLMYHPYVKKYVGFDVYKPSIDWSLETIVPRTGPRFEFHLIDVISATYNPRGQVRGTEVVFPADDGTIDLAFASSLFTHLFEPDARHYLREVKRVLAPGAIFLPSIHIDPASGTDYSGDEVRIDINPDYFVQLAQEAGLRMLERLGDLCGQEAFLFTTG
jgi:SAM-dependent methyltransferase